jgi:uncharacterized membrane protein YdjX (TVP38/TMEM64 family)
MSKLKRALFLQLAGLALGVGAVVWASRHYPVLDAIVRLQNTIVTMGFWGAVLYPLLYATCNVLLLPAGVLAVGSGLFFGLWWGFALNLAGNVAGAAGAFFISRTFGRKWIARRFLQHPRWAALDEAIERDGWKIIFLSQLPPLSPVSLLDYLYGITRVRFGTCMLWVAIGQAPSMFLYAYLGTIGHHGLRLWQGKINPPAWEYVLWIGGLVLTLIATIALGRIALRALAEAENAVSRPPSPTLRTRLQPPEAVTVEAEAQ